MANTADSTVIQLTSEELAVVNYLVEDWKKRYRVTTVEQGIKALGYPKNTEMRLRIGAYLKSVYAKNPDFSQRVQRWGLDTLILTNDEKLVAKCIICSLIKSTTVSTEEIAEAVGINAEQVEIALDVLRQLGFFDRVENNGKIRYRLAGDYERFLKGLGLTFHTVILEDGEEFNVQCSADALILAESDYKDRNVLIEDACFHCLERIEIRIDKGKLVSEKPQGIRLYEGYD